MPFVNGGGGSGGSQPVTREQFFGIASNIADNAQGNLTWDNPQGDALLNLSTPGLPTVVAAGVYAVSVTVTGNSITVGGYYQANLDMDTANEDARVTEDSPTASASHDNPLISLANTYYVPAGGIISVSVANLDGSATRAFAMSAVVQRLS